MIRNISNILFLALFLAFSSICSCFAAGISSFDAVTEGLDTNIRLCLSEKQNFKISNDDKSKKLIIDLENVKDTYKFDQKDVVNTTLLKEIYSKQHVNNTQISIASYAPVKIEDFEFNNQTKCLNIKLVNAESKSLLNRLKKENMPWISFEKTNMERRKSTIKLVKKQDNFLISPLKTLSKNIQKVKNNIITVASSSNSKEPNVALASSSDIVSIKHYKTTKISDNTIEIYNPKPFTKAEIKQIIVIDPGHGGQDYGTVNRETKIKEKDVTLRYAKDLKKILESTGKYTVFLTRDSDEFLPLLHRSKIATKKHADLFISIHADGIETPNLSSIGVYKFSQKASDMESEKLARLENASDYMISNPNFAIEAINNKIQQKTNTQNASKKLLKVFAENIEKVTSSKIKSSNAANFRMLQNPDIPSILIELGFANQEERGQVLLSSKIYMDKINHAITSSINEYFR